MSDVNALGGREPRDPEPVCLRLFSVEFRSPVDGKHYTREIAAQSEALCQETCDKLGAGERVRGEVMSMGIATPDGPLTFWRNDNG